MTYQDKQKRMNDRVAAIIGQQTLTIAALQQTIEDQAALIAVLRPVQAPAAQEPA